MHQTFAEATAEQGLGFQLYDEPMERVNVAQFCVLYVIMHRNFVLYDCACGAGVNLLDR